MGSSRSKSSISINLLPGHKYSVDRGDGGIIVPSVTWIISQAGLSPYQGIPKFRLEQKRMLGEAVHLACHLYNINDLDWSSVTELIGEYLQQWINFKNDYGFQVVDSEKCVYHPKYNYAGKLDVTGTIKKELSLVDLKTVGVFYPNYKLQTAAYKAGYEATTDKKIKRRLCVRLTKTKYFVEEHSSATDMFSFLACLQLVNFKIENNMIENIIKKEGEENE